MLMTASLVAMFLAASPADNAYAARQQFTDCLDAELSANLDKKTTPEEFDKAIGPACQAKQDAWKKAYVSADVSDGLKSKVSEENFALDSADFLESQKSRYKDFFDSNTKPAKK